MLISTIDRSVGVGPWSFVVTTEHETVLVRCPTASSASFQALALRNDPRIECEVSPVFPPQVVHYYEEA